MVVESTIEPNARFEIKKISENKCDIYFYNNVKELEKNNSELNYATKSYQYEIYIMRNFYREGLEKDIEQNFEFWLDKAKKYEKKDSAEAKNIREIRNNLLTETDWTRMDDAQLSDEEKKKYQEYRQKLRDIPEQPGFPFDVEFPSVEVK